jgi:hypothetical protein
VTSDQHVPVLIDVDACAYPIIDEEHRAPARGRLAVAYASVFDCITGPSETLTDPFLAIDGQAVAWTRGSGR